MHLFIFLATQLDLSSRWLSWLVMWCGWMAKENREQMLSDQPNWPLPPGFWGAKEESSGANEIRLQRPTKDKGITRPRNN